MAGPNCFKCKHFHITWDQSKPKGCKVFGFKGMQVPSVTVQMATGRPCTSFEAKPEKKKDKLDLNRDDLW